MSFSQGGGVDYDPLADSQKFFTGTLVLVPEPSTGLLVSIGPTGLAARRRSLRA